MTGHEKLLRDYLAGIDELREIVVDLTPEQLRARPVPGKWSTLEVLCHLADSEAVFADRMKRILAEERPALPFADPARFAPALAYESRDAEVEIDLIALIRRQMAAILRAQPDERWSRVGVHSVNGPCTLEQVVDKAVSHLEHHLAHVRDKRAAMFRRNV